MRLSQQAHWWLAAFLATPLITFPAAGQDGTNVSTSAPQITSNGKSLSNSATGKCPIDLFRHLLAMTPDERDAWLTNRPPDIRARIQVKVTEYQMMTPNDRELRLRATELRWYLMPLLRDPPANRAALLAQVPPDLQQLVQTRLSEWTILPPTLKQEFLENEHILDYFAQVKAGNGATGANGREPTAAERAHWNALSEPERRQVSGGFYHFFELTPDEKQSALNTLSDPERQQMEKTLQAFDKMPPAQRSECVSAFARFASMTTLEKAEFLKNAERWAAMSPAERQAWRDLVVNVPQWPPLPIGWTMPIPGESGTGTVSHQ